MLISLTTWNYLYAQEASSDEVLSSEETALPAESVAEEEAGDKTLAEIHVLTPEQNRIDMDIKTSTLSELAAWCRSVGLPEAGTSADLAQRLRDYFKITENEPQGEDKRKVITIESARTSEYFKIEEIDEEYARLTGDVKITLKDGDAIHEIQAWNILFNRTRNVLTASGGVEYIKTEGDKIETFRGESITVDLDNWSSIFLGGVSERSLHGDDTTYKFSGTVISRDDEEVVVLNKATIGTANNEESLWSLNASRVWLLPGSDFAIFNAVLKVGEIPVLYIPFFFYPADELIFHPVIGYRTREGNYVQTTTYILGRPKATSSTQSSSLTKILGSSADMEKKREGLFLRSTGKKAIDSDAVSLRAMVDYYANLGGYVGMDLGLPGKGIFSALDLSMGVGLTRTVIQDGYGNWTPYRDDGTDDWNYSNLFSNEVPFRYRLRTNSSINGQYGSFSWDLPFYSDPYVDSDFLRRAEEMDWVNLLQQGAVFEEEEYAQNQLGNYVWQFSGRLTPKIDASPYITSLSISSISSTVSFRTIDGRNAYRHDEFKYNSPSSFFFAPDTATLFSVNGSIAGTPLTLGGGASGSSVAKTDAAELPNPLQNIGIPRSPFEEKEKEDLQRRDTTDKLVPPELNQRFDLPRLGNNSFSIDYSIAPSAASTLKFDNNKWEKYDDISWSDVSSLLYNFGGDARTTLNFNHSENLYSNSFSYSGNGTWRDIHIYEEKNPTDFVYTSGANSGEIDPDKVEAAKLQEYRQSFFSTSYNFSSSVRPLYQNEIFKSSSLQYNLKGLAVRSLFDEQNSTGDDPQWDLDYGEWTKEKIDSHQFTTNISAQIMDKTQTISFSSDLPPRDPIFSWRASFRVWITETDANMTIRFPADREKRELEPFYLTERLNFGNFGSFSQSIELDTKASGEISSLTTSLNLTKWGITASYSASRMLGYEYIPLQGDSSSPTFEGWRQREGEAKAGDPNFVLRSNDFILTYAHSWSLDNLWKKRLQFSIDTNARLYLDFQRYTRSNFTFGLGFSALINNFLKLSMSANTENAYIYRYLRNMPFFDDADIDIPDGPQNNVFLDLINSFRFDNDELRRSSGFKMKNFIIEATHYLGDWNAKLTWTMYPHRPLGSRQFEMNNEVAFLVQWVPISEIKTDVTYNKRNTPEYTIK